MELFLECCQQAWHKHRNFLIGAFLACLVLGISLGAVYSALLKELDTYFHQIYEKKSWSELQAYHDGTVLMLENFFERRENILRGLAVEAGFREALDQKDWTRVLRILDRQRAVNNQFEEFRILDARGIVLAASSSQEEVKNLVGEDLSERGYVQAALRKKEVVIEHESRTLLGSNKIFFATPVFNDSDNITYVIVGGISIDWLSRRLSYQTDFSTFETLILDNYGEILLRNGLSLPGHINVRDQDRVVGQILTEEKEVRDEEINYEGKRVFAVAKGFNRDQENPLYLVAYYPVEQFENDAAGLRSVLKGVFAKFLVIGAVILVCFTSLIIVLILRHESMAQR